MECCQKCGAEYSEIWSTHDELWQKVTGITDGSGLYCIGCFSRMAVALGYEIYWLAGLTGFKQAEELNGR